MWMPTIRPKALFMTKDKKIAQYKNTAWELEHLDTEDCRGVKEIRFVTYKCISGTNFGGPFSHCIERKK
jgi:hypothetical protein